jgi:ubiquitin conjugation factor E4 B
VPYLLHEIESENGLTYEFFQEALSRFDEDDTIEPLFTKSMVDISSKLSSMSMNGDYKSCVNVSRLAVTCKLEQGRN